MKSRRIPCDVSNLADVRGFMREALQEFDVPESLMNAIVLSVEEICANAIIHSNERNAAKQLELTVDRNEGEVMVETRDQGSPFNQGSYAERTILDLINDRRRGGMGLMLVRRLMDRAEYERRNGENVWRLGKNLPANGGNQGLKRQA